MAGSFRARKPRMKTRIAASILSFVAVAFTFSQVASANENKDIKHANSTVQSFLKTDPGLKKFVDSSAGYVVFPSVGKGAVGVGGAHGGGVLFENGEPVGKASLSQVTVGLQLGGQSYSQIIFFQNQDTLNDFKAGNFAFQAQASAVALTAGASASLNYDKGVAVVTATKSGLMYEASIGGQKFGFHPYERQPVRGKSHSH
jgi:lipid-binding SYLF domain-containing protein